MEKKVEEQGIQLPDLLQKQIAVVSENLPPDSLIYEKWGDNPENALQLIKYHVMLMMIHMDNQRRELRQLNRVYRRKLRKIQRLKQELEELDKCANIGNTCTFTRDYAFVPVVDIKGEEKDGMHNDG